MAKYDKEVEELQRFLEAYEDYWHVCQDPMEYYGDPDDAREDLEAAQRLISEKLPGIERLVAVADQDNETLPLALDRNFRESVKTVLHRAIGAYKDGLPWKGDAPQQEGGASTLPASASGSWSQARENFYNHPVVWVTALLVPAVVFAFLAGRSYQKDLDDKKEHGAMGRGEPSSTPPPFAAGPPSLGQAAAPRTRKQASVGAQTRNLAANSRGTIQVNVGDNSPVTIRALSASVEPELGSIEMFLNGVPLSEGADVPPSRRIALTIRNTSDVRITGTHLHVVLKDAHAGGFTMSTDESPNLLPRAIGVPFQVELEVPPDASDVILHVEAYGDNLKMVRFDVPMKFTGPR